MARFKLVRTSIDDRRKRLAARRAAIEQALDGPIPANYFSRSRETAFDILRARVQGHPFIDVGNVPNRGQMPDLPVNFCSIFLAPRPASAPTLLPVCARLRFAAPTTSRRSATPCLLKM